MLHSEIPTETGSNATMDSGRNRRIWTGLHRCRLPGHHNPLRQNRHSNRQHAPHSNRRIDHRLPLVTIRANGKTAARGRGNKRSGRSWNGISMRANTVHSVRRISNVSSGPDKPGSGGSETSAARSLIMGSTVAAIAPLVDVLVAGSACVPLSGFL